MLVANALEQTPCLWKQLDSVSGGVFGLIFIIVFWTRRSATANRYLCCVEILASESECQNTCIWQSTYSDYPMSATDSGLEVYWRFSSLRPNTWIHMSQNAITGVLSHWHGRISPAHRFISSPTRKRTRVARLLPPASRRRKSKVQIHCRKLLTFDDTKHCMLQELEGPE